MLNYIIFLQGAERSAGLGVFLFFCSFSLDVKLSQAYQHSLQTDVPAFSSLFKLTNQCALHHCNYGKNRNQPSWSSVRLSRTNQCPLPRSPVLMSCAACVCHHQTSAPGDGGFMLRCAMRRNARDQTSNRLGSMLLCSENLEAREAGKMKA